ncbi:hypothetical protein [Streptomyces sp. NPDC004291]
MDDDFPYDDPLPDEPRMALLTAEEAREVVVILTYFADDAEKGRTAGGLAHLLAMRIPSTQRPITRPDRPDYDRRRSGHKMMTRPGRRTDQRYGTCGRRR